MGFGYNRYALVLSLIAAAGTLAGCSGKSSSNKGFFASTTVAPTTSSTTSPTTSSTPAPTTTASTTPLAQGPLLQQIEFEDKDSDNTVSKGDRVKITFDADLDPAFTGAGVDPAAELALAVNGDTFGRGATILAGGPKYNEMYVVLGDNPKLNVTDRFDKQKTQPGAASAINVSPNNTRAIKGRDADVIRAAADAIDISGTLQPAFHAVASLNVARGGHSAVTLDDGRVLVVGGISTAGKSGYVAEAELFDPLANSWTRVTTLSGDAGKMKRGSVEVRMAQATAVKLTDGTVLICGGHGIEKKSFFGLGSAKVDTLESAFIFNPADNTFRKVGDMNYPRHSHTATLMSDGRVLIAGGYNDSWWSSQKTQAPFEIYDPAKGKFEKSGSIFSRFKSKEPRMDHTASVIENGGGILLTGGSYYDGGHLFGLIKPKHKMTKGSEVVRGTSTERAGDLSAPRMNHAARTVTPRSVLIAGGHDLAAVVAGIELYDSATARWTAKGDLSVARTGCEIVQSRSWALIVGGFDGAREVDTVEAFDVDAGSLTASSYKLASARNSFAVVELQDGRVLVIGGLTGGSKSYESLDGQAIASCEAFVRH